MLKPIAVVLLVSSFCGAATAQFTDENVSVVHTLKAHQDGDGFGSIVRAIPDVDGDRKDDIAVSAPRHRDASGGVRGAVFVYSGKSGAFLWRAVGNLGSEFGASVSGSPDLDGDTHGDVLVGAPADDDSGSVYVFSGKTGNLLGVLGGEAKGDRFGAAVHGPGDFDRDRSNDIVVGAPGHDSGGAEGGRIYLYSWKKKNGPKKTLDGTAGQRMGASVQALPRSHRPLLVAGGSGRARFYRGMKLKGQKWIEFEGEAPVTVAILGDIDKDSYPDIYAADGKSVRIVSSDKGGLIRSHDVPVRGAGRVGDINRDAWEDVIVGDPSATEGRGRLTVFSGKDGVPLVTIEGSLEDGGLGTDVHGIRDLSGDRHADLLVGRPGKKRGTVYVLSGKPRPPAVDAKPESGAGAPADGQKESSSEPAKNPGGSGR